MDKEKLKLIIKNLESLVDCLKSEIYSDIDSYKQESQYEQIAPYIDDYDEIYVEEEDDDEIFSTLKVNKKYKITNDDDGDVL